MMSNLFRQSLKKAKEGVICDQEGNVLHPRQIDQMKAQQYLSLIELKQFEIMEAMEAKYKKSVKLIGYRQDVSAVLFQMDDIAIALYPTPDGIEWRVLEVRS